MPCKDYENKTSEKRWESHNFSLALAPTVPHVELGFDSSYPFQKQ